MKTYLMAFTLIAFGVACQKSNDDTPEKSKIDISKITGIEWKSSKSNLPFWIYKFNSDNTGYQKHIKNTLDGSYFHNDITWSITAGDTLRIAFPQYGSYTERMRIFAITDTTLIMNDFNVNTGAAVPDTVVYYR